MSPVEEVIKLAKDAEAKISVTFNSPDVLHYTTQALSIIESNPSLYNEFKSEFIKMPYYAPSEFIQVCMHALLWSEVKLEFERRQEEAIKKNDWRAEPVYRHLLEAFDPSWEDAKDFYVDYFGSS